MPHLITNEQNAFVKGRLISNNIIISHKIMHYLKTRSKGGKRGFALKLNINQAYDIVEWTFLKQMLMCLGFDQQWISQVMECVSIVSYIVRVNGYSYKLIKLARGLRQGNPLSPFQYLFCIEGLSHLIHQFDIEDIIISKRIPSIKHLLFADDSIQFSRANMSEARKVRSILQNYSIASGQMVNLVKSTIFFSPNTPV